MKNLLIRFLGFLFLSSLGVYQEVQDKAGRKKGSSGVLSSLWDLSPFFTLVASLLFELRQRDSGPEGTDRRPVQWKRWFHKIRTRSSTGHVMSGRRERGIVSFPGVRGHSTLYWVLRSREGRDVSWNMDIYLVRLGWKTFVWFRLKPSVRRPHGLGRWAFQPEWGYPKN